MNDLTKHHLLKTSIVLLMLTIVFLISPSSSNQETRASTQKTKTYNLNGEEESPHQLVYIKKTTPFILNHRLRDHHHHLRRYNHPYYYYYRHSRRRRGLHHRPNYFKMMSKKKSGYNGLTSKNPPVRPEIFTVMLPKGTVPPSGSSPCHNQNPNSATTLFCDLSIQP